MFRDIYNEFSLNLEVLGRPDLDVLEMFLKLDSVIRFISFLYVQLGVVCVTVDVDEGLSEEVA